MTLHELRRALQEIKQTNDAEKMVTILQKMDGLNTYLRAFYSELPRLISELHEDIVAKELVGSLNRSKRGGLFGLVTMGVTMVLNSLQYDNSQERYHISQCHRIAEQALEKLNRR